MKKIINLFAFFLVIILSSQKVTLNKMSEVDNVKFPQMWEISTRPWLYSLSEKYNKNITKLNQIPEEEFQALRNKGIDVVWLMGVWSLGIIIIF